MNNITTLQYWGYLHVDGTTHTKRYFSEQDIEEAKTSPFVKEYIGPFDADHIGDAAEYIVNYFKQKQEQKDYLIDLMN